MVEEVKQGRIRIQKRDLKIYDALQGKQKSHNIATDDVTKFRCY